MAEDKVKAPGIILMVVAGLNLMIQLAQIAYYGVIMVIGLSAQRSSASAGGGGGDEEIFLVLYIAVMIVFAILAIAWNGFIGYAGWQMQKLERYNLALAGSIMAVIPCFGCCLLNMPAGIFALVVINDRMVKEAFRS